MNPASCNFCMYHMPPPPKKKCWMEIQEIQQGSHLRMWSRDISCRGHKIKMAAWLKTHRLLSVSPTIALWQPLSWIFLTLPCREGIWAISYRTKKTWKVGPCEPEVNCLSQKKPHPHSVSVLRIISSHLFSSFPVSPFLVSVVSSFYSKISTNLYHKTKYSEVYG